MPVPPLALLLLDVLEDAPWAFSFFSGLLSISLLQLQLLQGRLVRVANSSYEFLALLIGEDVAHVGDVLPPEKALAEL